jgi:hypothetical protein
MMDEHTPTLQQIPADRDWWSADAGSTTASWRIGYAASPPNAGFRIRRKSYSISPGGMIPEPITSVADLLTLAGRRGVPAGGLLGMVRLTDLEISKRY